MKPRIAIVSFPGTNGDTENLRALQRNGFDAFVFRWNDDLEKLKGTEFGEEGLPRASREAASRGVDGYFIGAGFAYEDRGRSGMVAARDPLFRFLHEEAQRGKVIVGHCNGCQVLVESGLIPLGSGLRMSMARNAVRGSGTGTGTGTERWIAPGFLNEWVYITRTCARDRCVTSDWVDSTGSPFNEVMRVPIAHGEGRFVTKDPDLIAELEKNDQIAFRYCDADGNVSQDPAVTPNGSTGAIAGICNPAGNVVALMPHPERTVNGDPYFQSMRRWLERHEIVRRGAPMGRPVQAFPVTGRPSGAPLQTRAPRPLEIFIDTIIVNNEERTVEQAARRIVPLLKLKQFRYLTPAGQSAETVLTTIALFNPNKEIAYVRSVGAPHPSTRSSLRSDRCGAGRGARGKKVQPEHSAWHRWDSETKTLNSTKNPLSDTTLLRRDEPDICAQGLDRAPNQSPSTISGDGSGQRSETGICYSISGVNGGDLQNPKLREIFANPHASTLETML